MSPDNKRFRPFFRTKAALAVSAFTLAFSQIACGGSASKQPDPCDKAFQILVTAFADTRPDVIGEDYINIWPSDPSGKSTHPRIENWQNRDDVSWSEVVSYIKFNCGDKYEVQSLAANQEENFYDEGVIIKRKPKQTQNFSLPELNGGVVVTPILASILALLGLSRIFSFKKRLA